MWGAYLNGLTKYVRHHCKNAELRQRERKEMVKQLMSSAMLEPGLERMLGFQPTQANMPLALNREKRALMPISKMQDQLGFKLDKRSDFVLPIPVTNEIDPSAIKNYKDSAKSARKTALNILSGRHLDDAKNRYLPLNVLKFNTCLADLKYTLC